MEIKQGSVIVMTPEGTFLEVQRKINDCHIGEEIWFASPRRRLAGSSIAMFSSMAAVIAFVIVFVSIFSWVGAKEVVAYVSIDINPSIEIGIDNGHKVRSLVGLNQDGKLLIKGVQFSGRPLTDVTEDLLRQAENQVLSRGAADIIVASTVVGSNTKLKDDILSLEVKELITEHVRKMHPDQADQYVVAAFSAPETVREAAANEGISTGKYAVYLNAKNNGYSISIDEMKQTSIYVVAQQAGGLNELIGPEPLTKEEIKELWEEEKNGSLDKKLQLIRQSKEFTDQADKAVIESEDSNGKAEDKDDDLKQDNKEKDDDKALDKEQEQIRKEQEQIRKEQEKEKKEQEKAKDKAKDKEQQQRKKEQEKWEKEQEKEKKELEKEQKKKQEQERRDREKYNEELEKEKEKEKEQEKRNKEQEKQRQEQEKDKEKEQEKWNKEQEKQRQEQEKEKEKEQEKRNKEQEKQQKEQEKKEKEQEKRNKEQEKQQKEQEKEKEKEQEKRNKEQEKQRQDQEKEKEKEQEKWNKEQEKQQKEQEKKKEKEQEKRSKEQEKQRKDQEKRNKEHEKWEEMNLDQLPAYKVFYHGYK
ncbi:Regulation of sigma I protein [Chlamydia abortus]|nr:Regulation of sigma I protein [Chlamydia abortus]